MITEIDLFEPETNISEFGRTSLLKTFIIGSLLAFIFSIVSPIFGTIVIFLMLLILLAIIDERKDNLVEVIDSINNRLDQLENSSVNE